ncbi:MAG: hypothetical protein K2M08_07845 [Anaeroplasmataceae bacterium]|nr:hypothetical protein [Anaeroplasmataceae bacterium]
MKKIIVTCILFASLFLGVCFGFKSNAYTLDDNGNLISDNVLSIKDGTYGSSTAMAEVKNGVIYLYKTSTYNINIFIPLNVPVRANTTYSFLAFENYTGFQFFLTAGLNDYTNRIRVDYGATFSVNYNITYIQIYMTESGRFSDFELRPMLNEGSTAKPYEPYGIWYSDEWVENASNNAYQNGYDIGYADGKNEYYQQFSDIFINSTLIVSYSTSTGDKIAYQGGVISDTINENIINLGYYQDKVSYTEVIPANATRLDIYFNNANGILLQQDSIYLNIYDGQYMTENGRIAFNLGYNSGNNGIGVIDGSYLKLVSGSSTGLGRWVLTVPDGLSNAYMTQLLIIGFNTSSDMYIDDLIITNNSLQVGYGQGFNAGYTSGLENGKEQGYNNGFNDGIEQGKNEGYQSGYNQGYTDGSGSDNTLVGMMFAIVDAPFQILKDSMNFNFLGVNIADFIFSFITLILVLKIFHIFF